MRRCPTPHTTANFTAISQQAPQARDPGSPFVLEPASSLKAFWSFHLVILSMGVTAWSVLSWS